MASMERFDEENKEEKKKMTGKFLTVLG